MDLNYNPDYNLHVEIDYGCNSHKNWAQSTNTISKSDDANSSSVHVSIVDNMYPTIDFKCEPMWVKKECASGNVNTDATTNHNTPIVYDIKCEPMRVKEECGSSNVNTDTTTNHNDPIVYDIDPTIEIKCEPMSEPSDQNNDHIHNDTQPFQCLICLKLFPSKRQLYQNIRHHAEKKTHKCIICYKAYIRKGRLAVHMRKTHIGEPYECYICHNRFNILRNFIAHKRTHTNCDICHKRFKQLHNLRVHMRTHTGEKPYQCDICKKQFKQSQHLSAHKRTHTGDEPFVCSICQTGFKRKRSLTQHVDKKHAGVKQSECKKMIIQQPLLTTHNEVHTFKCSICHKEFIEVVPFAVHMRAHILEMLPNTET